MAPVFVLHVLCALYPPQETSCGGLGSYFCQMFSCGEINQDMLTSLHCFVVDLVATQTQGKVFVPV